MTGTTDTAVILGWFQFGWGVLAGLVGMLVYNLVVSLLEQRQRDREFERSMEAFQAEAEAQHSSAMSAVGFSESEDYGRLFN